MLPCFIKAILSVIMHVRASACEHVCVFVGVPAEARGAAFLWCLNYRQLRATQNECWESNSGPLEEQ